MKLLITGARGTLGSAITALAQAQGHTPAAWNRDAADPLAPEHHGPYLDAVAPDAVIHLGIAATPTGRDNEGWRTNFEWPARLAGLCAARGIALLFTSTALVFDNSASGPFTLATPANAGEGYGREKRLAEDAVLRAHSAGARVVRLGWQIDPAGTGNNMVAHAHREMAQHGHVNASSRWFPACSFLADTAAALLALVQAPPGLYMADSNRGASFVDILTALSHHHGFGWQIRANEDYIYDQRLLDPRVPLPDLRTRLPTLPA